MPPRTASHDESRTSVIGNKRSFDSNNTSSKSRKKRRRNRPGKGDVHDKVSTNTSSLSQSPLEPSADQTVPSARLPMVELGKNRLATGFTRPAQLPQPEHQLSAADHTVGESVDSAIEISDEDEAMEDSEGGIVINLQGQSKTDLVSLSSSEEGEASESDEDDTRDSPHESRSEQAEDTENGAHTPFVVDPTPLNALLQKRLTDLNPDQLEDQFKYAFYHLDRHQIDLNRAVVCLECMSEGHLDSDCTSPPNMLPLARVKADVEMKLWISCCVCASKNHLVGDCPRANREQVTRWSLATLNPAQIVNLSLQSGTRKMEIDAENVGMRPTGLQIKGRADRHNAGVPRQADLESSEEDFLPSKRARGPRYDRFDAPAESPRNRGRNDWYATDSFGRRRSLSPDDTYRPNRDRRDATDTWRPSHPRDRDDRFDDRHSGPARRGPTSARPPPATAGPPPRPKIQMALPTRKGSNPFVHGNSASGSATPASTVNSGGGGGGGGGGKKKKKRNKKGQQQ